MLPEIALMLIMFGANLPVHYGKDPPATYIFGRYKSVPQVVAAANSCIAEESKFMFTNKTVRPIWGPPTQSATRCTQQSCATSMPQSRPCRLHMGLYEVIAAGYWST